MKGRFKNDKILRRQAFIDGAWVDHPKGKSFAVINPFDGKEIASVPDLGERETEEAIEAAYWAFPAWSSLLARERTQKLKRLAVLIEKNAQDLALLLTLEQGKPLQEALMEVLDGANTIAWFAEEAGRVSGLTQCDPDEGRSVMTIRQPMGVIGVIAPWNFPFSIAASKSCAALAAGCTVVLKPAEDTPLSSLAFAYLSQEAGIPAGVLNVVTTLHPEKVGKALMSNPLVSKITFTGSTEVGKKLMAASASTVKRLTLELGGNCPAIVFEDADIEKALQGIHGLKFFNAGQCCNSINRILVHRSLYDSFIEQFEQMLNGLRIGSGLDSPNLGPLINEAAMEKIASLLDEAVSNGAELIATSRKKIKGLLCPPMIIKNAKSQMRIFNEEIFGPIAVFYSFETEDEAIAMANDTRMGLAAYVYTEDVSRIMRVAKELEAGSVGVNTTNVYSATLPFGGWKESGIGREGGIQGILDNYCEIKSISIGL